jgi:hypothetical protein
MNSIVRMESVVLNLGHVVFGGRKAVWDMEVYIACTYWVECIIVS